MIPSSNASNTMYVKELDRIVLKDKVSERVFGNLSTVRSRTQPPRSCLSHAAVCRKTAIMTRVLELIRQVCAPARKGCPPASYCSPQMPLLLPETHAVFS